MPEQNTETQKQNTESTKEFQKTSLNTILNIQEVYTNHSFEGKDHYNIVDTRTEIDNKRQALKLQLFNEFDDLKDDNLKSEIKNKFDSFYKYKEEETKPSEDTDLYKEQMGEAYRQVLDEREEKYKEELKENIKSFKNIFYEKDLNLDEYAKIGSDQKVLDEKRHYIKKALFGQFEKLQNGKLKDLVNDKLKSFYPNGKPPSADDNDRKEEYELQTGEAFRQILQGNLTKEDYENDDLKDVKQLVNNTPEIKTKPAEESGSETSISPKQTSYNRRNSNSRTKNRRNCHSRRKSRARTNRRF